MPKALVRYEFEIFRWMQVMPPNVDHRCSSLVFFLLGYKLPIFTMFSLQNMRKLSGFLSKSSVLLAKLNICYLYQRIWHRESAKYIQTHKFLVSSNRKWVGFGSFLGPFNKCCTLKPRKY